MKSIGLITIGQSPREDIVASMFGTISPDGLIECGALDNLTLREVEGLAPRNGEHPLVSRLRDGSEVVVAKERLMPHMQAAVDSAIGQGAGLIVILCTGEFTQLSIGVPTIYPDRVLGHVVEAILPRGTAGVMLPHPGQMESMCRKWRTNMRTFEGIAVSPYTDVEELARHAVSLKDRGSDLIVLDCMGFDLAMKRTVADASGLPVILANRLVGRVLEELTSAAE
ncbi:MAG: AroM family protein [Nitrolancea sp.]